MTQEELARAIGVGTRTIGRWERGESVPRSAAGALEKILRLREGDAPPAEPTLPEATDAELVAEIARRLSRGASAHGGTGGDLPAEHYRWPKANAAKKSKADEA